MYFFSGVKSIKKIWKDKAFYGKMPIDGLLPQITRHKATCCNIAEESMDTLISIGRLEYLARQGEDIM
jgi:hypothetical protein